MLRCLRCFAEAFLILALVGAPAGARQKPAPAADPAVVLPDKVLAKKALVEQTKARVDAALGLIRTCAASAAPGESRVALESELGQLEAQVKDALWTYNVGNYEEAFKRYTALERSARTVQLVCDKVRLAAERCSKGVAAALERIRSWGVKIARIQDPTLRAHCETLFTETANNLLSLDKTCATTDPAWVARQVPIVIKPLDDALRTAK